ncbi:D-isomer specific 2-hydroxyacid dehydrogenase family protein [Antrihabitans cavernicola]|uniref:Hydroxyacid dehydrogenase n=1 Tax=Antrihabitans cavernicola TaxID=2495913 RepID=A0A5A7SE94_9NOCA|nr:D-isomer specific 2-hydroxyacid dehydrogenase family protein [Spelaeibacter cavernicola]KAA0022943.1 hydroxyacid dehydrogenase [Spelaeibacter cavernicola]
MSDDRPSPSIAVHPDDDARLVDAVVAGGGATVPLESARALVWNSGSDTFPDQLPDGIEWVQLPAAGIEDWFTSGVIERNPNVHFTSAAGAFAPSVAEHAVALLLAGVRSLPQHLLATTWRQQELAPTVGTLRGATVAIVGAGGIGRAMIPMLAALGAHVVAVNRSGCPVPGAVHTYPVSQLADVWAEVHHVIIGAPATPATKHLVGKEELAKLKPTSWVINIARGSLIDTDALVEALTDGTIGGVGLDVTEPEPLPDGHPLWSLPNAIVTPHDSNPPQHRLTAYAERVRDNVARFAAGEELIASVDPVSGY